MPHGLPTSFSPHPKPQASWDPSALLPDSHLFPSGCLASLCPCSGAQSSLLCGWQAGRQPHPPGDQLSCWKSFSWRSDTDVTLFWDFKGAELSGFVYRSYNKCLKCFPLLSPNASPCSFLPFDSCSALKASDKGSPLGSRRKWCPPCLPVLDLNIPCSSDGFQEFLGTHWSHTAL